MFFWRQVDNNGARVQQSCRDMPWSSPALRSVAPKKNGSDPCSCGYSDQLVLVTVRSCTQSGTEFIFPCSLEVIRQIDLRLRVIGISHPPENRTKPVTKPNPPQTRTKPAKHHTKPGPRKAHANPNFDSVFSRERLRGFTKSPPRGRL